MEVLISDRRSKSQLSILLRELGYAPNFHDAAESLRHALSEDASNQVVLVDLNFEFGHEAFLADFNANSGKRFIGLQFFTSSQGAGIHENAKYYRDSIVLPAHAERAKSRLKNVLTPFGMSGQQSFSSSASSRRQQNALKRGYTRSFTPRVKSRPPFSFNKDSKKETPAFREGARYLVCQSDASKDLLHRIQRLGRSEKLAHLLVGEDGTEFELVCREINFQITNERTALHMVSPDDLSIDELEKMERAASRNRETLHVYVGCSDDYSAENLHQLELFIDYLANLRNPHLHIYLAHTTGGEEFFRQGAVDIFKSLRPKMELLSVPHIAERIEDIPEICQTTIGLLRAAHPFLAVQRISSAAIQYLVDTRHELSHQKLVRVIRNSIALSQRQVLCVEDIKNYGESGLTNQHLLESMADENFFPSEQSANF